MSTNLLPGWPHLYSILNDNQVCYLVLTEKSFSKRLAFTYLENVQNEFRLQYGPRIHTVTRPYSFIEFGMLLAPMGMTVYLHSSTLYPQTTTFNRPRRRSWTRVLDVI